jgi:hypothetical protein
MPVLLGKLPVQVGGYTQRTTAQAMSSMRSIRSVPVLGSSGGHTASILIGWRNTMSNKDTKEKALVPTTSLSREDLRAKVDSEVPALVGGFQLGPRRLSRVGKVHLGYKHSETGYPKETCYFVFDDPEAEAALIAIAKPWEIVTIDGIDHLTALEIIFPCNIIRDNVEVVFAEYNSKRQCLCTSRDGITARKLKPDTGEIAEIPCLNENCPRRQAPPNKHPACGEIMRMKFIIPAIPPLGVWQLDSGSTWSKNSVLGYMRMLQAEITNGQIAGIRLKLSRQSTMIADKNTNHLQEHWPLYLVANISYDSYAETLAAARAMTYEAKDVEEFDESPDETIVSGNGDVDGVIVDEATGEILLPEEVAEGEIVEEENPGVGDMAVLEQLREQANLRPVGMWSAYIKGILGEGVTSSDVPNLSENQLDKLIEALQQRIGKMSTRKEGS